MSIHLENTLRFLLIPPPPQNIRICTLHTVLGRFDRAVEFEAQMKSELLQLLFEEIRDNNNIALCNQFLEPMTHIKINFWKNL